MMNNRERPYARHPGSYKDHSNFDGYRNNDEYLNDEYDLDDDDLYTYSGRRQDEEEYEDNMEPDDYNWYEDTDDYNDEYDNTYRRDELTGQMGGETRRARSTVTKSRTRTKGKKRDAVQL